MIASDYLFNFICIIRYEVAINVIKEVEQELQINGFDTKKLIQIIEQHSSINPPSTIFIDEEIPIGSCVVIEEENFDTPIETGSMIVAEFSQSNDGIILNPTREEIETSGFIWMTEPNLANEVQHESEDPFSNSMSQNETITQIPPNIHILSNVQISPPNPIPSSSENRTSIGQKQESVVKNHIFYPKPVEYKGKRKSNFNLPSAISSQAWRDINTQKDTVKKIKVEHIIERKKQLEKRKEETKKKQEAIQNRKEQRLARKQEDERRKKNREKIYRALDNAKASGSSKH